MIHFSELLSLSKVSRATFLLHVGFYDSLVPEIPSGQTDRNKYRPSRIKLCLAALALTTSEKWNGREFRTVNREMIEFEGFSFNFANI